MILPSEQLCTVNNKIQFKNMIKFMKISEQKKHNRPNRYPDGHEIPLII